MDRITIGSNTGYCISVDNKEEAKIEIAANSIITIPQGPQGEPADPAVLESLQDQINVIYTPGHNPPVVSNGTFVDGLLYYTGGTLNSFYGLNHAGLLFDHAANLRITGEDFDVWVDDLSSYSSGPYGSQDFMRVTANGATISAMHRDQNGLHMLTTLPYTAGVPVDVAFTATGLRIEHAGNVYQSPELDVPISYPKTKFLTAADTTVIDLQAAASGLLPDETAARIAGDAALAGQIANKVDQAVLADLQAQISAIYAAGGGGPEQIIPAVSGGSYVDGVLTYTGGQLRPGLPAAGAIIDGLARLEFAGNTPEAYVACSNASTGFDELSGHTPATRPCLIAVIGADGAGTVTFGWATTDDGGSVTVTVGTDPFTVEFFTDRVVVTVGGVAHVSPICPVPLTTPHTKMFTLSSAEVSFFTPGGGPSGLLPDETAARIAGDAALADAIADVQTLAQVNQLNIAEKADQTDLDTLQTTVTGQGLTLAQKANQTALDALTTVVSGKATPADITAAIAALVNGAPDALNTLSEIATALAGEQAQIADLLAALALRVRVDAVQSLTLAQQLQARQNINAEAVGVAAGLVAAITPASIGAATAVQGGKADTALQSADMAPVALSGQYSDLAGLPTIPGLSSSTPAAPTTGGTAGTATTAARGDHAHPLPTSAQITAAVLTGLASGSATAIAAADTILQALAKLQAQATANAANISTNSGLLAPVDRKIGSSWYVSGGWYDVEYPRYAGVLAGTVTLGQAFYIPRQILENATFTSLAFYCSTGAAGAVAYAGIYSDNAGQPGSLLASFSADCSTTGVKSGSISLSLSAGQIVWDAFLLTGGAAQVYRYNITRALPEQGGAGENSRTFRFKTGQTDLSATATGTNTAQAASVPRLRLQCA